MTPAARESTLIRSLDPRFAPYVELLLSAMREVGWRPVLTSAKRTRREQEALIRAGKTTATRSLHLAGLAVDIGGLAPDELRQAGEFWESLGGRWGGRFKTPDPIHFDAGLS